MNLFLNEEFRIVCQGFTGSSATYHSKLSIEYGTKILCGVTPGKGGSIHLGLPVFNNIKEAISNFNINSSIIYVPAPFCKDSILESINYGIKLIVCITEGIPILDMLYIKKILNKTTTTLIGPNSPGITIPKNFCRMGIMPINIHKKGIVGIISRSGTLTYEAILQTTQNNLGQSISIGIGGDPIVGFNFSDALILLENDIDTKIILMIGEIGGENENKACETICNKIKKPIIAYIAGISAPSGKRMGHAGAIIQNISESAENKIKNLEKVGVEIVYCLTDLGKTLLKKYKTCYKL